MKRVLSAAAVLAALATPALAADTVQSLLAQGYTIVGTTSPPAGGGGLYLQLKEKLYFCFVVETPNSPALTTRYCKPVQ
jgi:opacity protein-like surface antigen